MDLQRQKLHVLQILSLGLVFALASLTQWSEDLWLYLFLAMTGSCVSGLYPKESALLCTVLESPYFSLSSPGNSGDELNLDLLDDSKVVLST